MIAITIVLRYSYFSDFAILLGKLSGIAYLPWLLTGLWTILSKELCGKLDMEKADADEQLADYIETLATRYIILWLFINLSMLVVLMIWAIGRWITDKCLAKE